MRTVFVLFLLVWFSSCHKDKTSPPPANVGVYILNEGNFNFGNGEVSYYNPLTDETSNDVFHAANGYSIGDVVESMYIWDSLGFIVVNNSAKIEVVEIPSLKKVKTIDIPGSSPRYFMPVNDSMGYVSDLYAQKVWVLNYRSGTVTGGINTTSWSEKMLMIGNDLFIQQKKLSSLQSSIAALLKVSTVNNSVINSKNFGNRDLNGIVKDKWDRIWVALDEDTAAHLQASLLCLNKDLTEQKSIVFSSFGHHPSRLCIDSRGEKLLFIDKDIFSVSIDDNALPSAPLISSSGKNIYALDVNPATDDIYISDVLDFVQQSQIYRYDKNGNLIHSFTAGIISGNFTFNNE